MSKFSIVILQRDTNIHTQCFLEVAKALAASLRELGHETVEVGEGGRMIAFGVNNGISVASNNPFPDDAIIFNTEQMTFFGGRVRTQMQSFDRYKNRLIWDYSLENIRRLREAGATNVVHCPIGYHPTMEYITSKKEEDVDVLFYGSMNPRRREILDALAGEGLMVEALFGAYGKERDDWIARSKVVLNVHSMDEAIFEIFRVSHLVANKKCVVSEDGGMDQELEKVADRICDVVPRDKIVYAVKELLRDHDLRRGLAETGYRAFTKMPFVESVRTALQQS